MSKKSSLLALAAASLAALVLPATAMAEITPLHMVPAPVGAKTIDGEGEASLKGSFGTIKCTGFSGTTTFTSSTAGTLEQTFKGCSGPTGTCTTAGQASGTITTTELDFDLGLLLHEHNSGIVGLGLWLTPNTVSGVFAHFDCPLFPNTTISGNGLLGTITNVPCGGSSSEPTIQFSSKSAGVQTVTTVKGISISIGLVGFGGPVSEDAAGKITLGTAAKLECT